MKALRIASLALLGAALLARFASAAIIEDFPFNEPANSPITGAVNSANPGNAWLSQNTAVESFSNGSGSFRINKTSVAGQVGNTLDIANITSGKVWLVAEIAGWAYTATPSATSERVRFGFLDNDPPAAGSSTISAEMQIDRLASNNNLTFTTDAGGTGSTATQTSSADWGISRNTPLTLVMEIDADTDKFTASYKDGANPWVSLPTGNLGERTAGVAREARSVRFAFTGNFGDTGEFFDVDRIYVTTTNPIPEPASVALLGVSCVAAAGWRRRCA
jgi:hypothetical protein